MRNFCHKLCSQGCQKVVCVPELHLGSCVRLTCWLLQLREDVTRYRYGDEQHLDESLGKIFMFNRVGALVCSRGFKPCAALIQSPCKAIGRVQIDTKNAAFCSAAHKCCCSAYCCFNAFIACKLHHNEAKDLLPSTHIYIMGLCC